MSIIIGIDPEAILEVATNPQNTSSVRLMMHILELENHIGVGVDENLAILNAYTDIRDEVFSSSVEILHTFFERLLSPEHIWMIENANGNKLLNDPDSFALLTDLGLEKPLKPDLLSVGIEAPGNTVLLINSEGWNIDKISLSNMPLVYTTQDDDAYNMDMWLGSYPTEIFPDKEHVPLIRNNLIENLHIPCEEKLNYEFKQPGYELNKPFNSSATLEKNLVRDAMEAVCGMLNQHYLGYVFIGIMPGKKSPRIEGFKRKHDRNGDIQTDDSISQYVRSFFNDFFPDCKGYVHLLVHTLDNDRPLVILKILQPPKRRVFLFDNQQFCGKFIRSGTTSSAEGNIVFYHGTLSIDNTVKENGIIKYQVGKEKREIVVPKKIISVEVITILESKKTCRVIFSLSKLNHSIQWVELDSDENKLSKKVEFLENESLIG